MYVYMYFYTPLPYIFCYKRIGKGYIEKSVYIGYGKVTCVNGQYKRIYSCYILTNNNLP